MNANVSIYQDSVKDSSGILTSESNEIGSLKIIMPDNMFSFRPMLNLYTNLIFKILAYYFKFIPSSDNLIPLPIYS